MEISSQEDHNDIPIPLNITTYGNNTSGGHGHMIHHNHHNHANSSLPFNNITTSNPLIIPSNGNNHDHYHHMDHQHHVAYNIMINKKKPVVKYKECLKNHAASMGGNATDGCGEFMPSGEDGSIEALTCSACNCHRNFHRREVEGEETFPNPYHNHPRKLMLTHYNHKIIKSPSPHQMIMPIGIATAATSNSDSEDPIDESLTLRPPPQLPPPPPPYSYNGKNQKKRFRTKFSQEQKEKMLSFAERVGWKIQRQEESVVQEFCQEIGVRRRVLKVWMHNNKHNLSKKNNDNNLEISGNDKDINDTNVGNLVASSSS